MKILKVKTQFLKQPLLDLKILTLSTNNNKEIQINYPKLKILKIILILLKGARKLMIYCLSIIRIIKRKRF